jgi:hypothetical protein
MATHHKIIIGDSREMTELSMLDSFLGSGTTSLGA